MYQYEGALSMVRETEEPEDEMTRKHSLLSSALSTSKLSQLHTPLGHTGLVKVESPAPLKLTDRRKASPKVPNQVLAVTSPTGAFSQNLLGKQKSMRKSIGGRVDQSSYMEDSWQMREIDSIEDLKPANQMLMAQQAPTPKSMTRVLGTTSSTSKLQELTKSGLSKEDKKVKSPQRQSQKSGQNSCTQLKSYLLRQQDLLKTAPTSGASKAISGAYRSPERPPQPNNFITAPSVQNSATIKREIERQPSNGTSRSSIEPAIGASLGQRPPPTFSQDKQGKPSPILSKQASIIIEEQKSSHRARSNDHSQNSFVIQSLPESSQQKFNRHLLGLNKSILNLREDIKERSVAIYKDVKSLQQKIRGNDGQLSPVTLEDKLDCEFLERQMHVYAFFTSCLNLVLQNDKEAHKLLILQPMIEKHMTDLALDKLEVQATGAATDIFDQTLSSIGLPQSCNMSVDASANINQTLLNQMSATRQGSVDRSQRGMTTQSKLHLLQTLQQLASQVLQLNELKYKLVAEGKPATTGAHWSGSTTKTDHMKGPSQTSLSSEFNKVPTRSKESYHSSPGKISPERIRLNAVKKSDKTSLPRQTIAAQHSMMVSPQRRQTHESEGALTSPRPNNGTKLYSRNVNDVYNSNTVLQTATSYDQASEVGTQKVKQVKDSYLQPGSPKTVGPQRQKQGSHSQSSAERPTQDSKQTQAQISSKQGGASYYQNTSFGGMNSSAGSASRNAHQAYLLYQQHTGQSQKTQEKQPQSEANGESFITQRQTASSYLSQRLASPKKPQDTHEHESTFFYKQRPDGYLSPSKQISKAYRYEEEASDVVSGQRQKNKSKQGSFIVDQGRGKANASNMLKEDQIRQLSGDRLLSCDKVELDSAGKIVCGLSPLAATNASQPPIKASFTSEISSIKKASDKLALAIKNKSSLVSPSKSPVTQRVGYGLHKAPSQDKIGSSKFIVAPNGPSVSHSRKHSGAALDSVVPSMSRNLHSQKARTAKATTTLPASSDEKLSEIDVSSLSHATVEHFDRSAKLKRSVVDNKSRSSKDNKRRTKKVPVNQSSFLASFNASVSQSHLDSLPHQKHSRSGGLSHYQSHGNLPDSRVKKLLKGVISAQDASLQHSSKGTVPTSHNTSVVTKQATCHPRQRSHTNNLNQVTGASQTNSSKSFVASSGRTVNFLSPSNREDTIQKSGTPSSSKKTKTQRTKNTQASSFHQSASLLSPQPDQKRQHFNRLHSQQLLHLTAGQPAQRANAQSFSGKVGATEPVSPSAQRLQQLSTATTTTAPKKKLQVSQNTKSSNYLLKQSIVVNTDKLLSPKGLKRRESCLRPEHLVTVPNSGHHTRINSSQIGNQMGVTQQSSNKTRRKEKPKSLSRAFSAITSAISRRKSNSSPSRTNKSESSHTLREVPKGAASVAPETLARKLAAKVMLQAPPSYYSKQ